VIIARTPLRISFAGGGTDLPSFYRAHGGGAVTSAAIDRYVYVVLNPHFDRSIRVAYSRTENVEQLDELQHGLVREAMRKVGVRDSIEIHTIADIPSQGTGLGSSSTLTVGLLNALYASRGTRADPERLASEACEIEIDRLGGTLGKQDQYIAAYGGVQHFEFHADGSVRTVPLGLSQLESERLASHLSLFYTGITRQAQGILRSQDARTEANKESLAKMRGLAEATRDALLAHDYERLGRLLDDGWQLKRTLSQGISTEAIDAAYARARSAGAYGGKVAGAGGGGFLLVVHPAGQSREIAAALPGMRHLPVRISSGGSQLLTVTD
jgi:D-glycero-alpha-D-manno-heptose-7-phosphate kinase